MSFISTSGVRIAQLVGIGASGYLAGFISACSIVGVPPLAFAPPEIATKQWAKLYRIGRARAPAIAASGLLAYIYLGYVSGHTVCPAEGYAYLAAGAATIAIVPYTLATMMATNNEIEGLAAGTEKAAANGERVKYLMQKWYKLNLGRSLFPLGGFVIGLLAVGGYFAE
ncbi:hypothetical protein C8Q72DRAFT_882607 [Fomitopsis betulina]|nr:hypothetical protein C8Q72DRAFT_882607 [Fomitopsis betulina]